MDYYKNYLMTAEQNAKKVFETVEERGLIVPGKLESQLSNEVVEIAEELFGIKTYWHKNIVRAGINTLQPFNGDPKNIQIQDNDIVFLDFGPIFKGWEADLGRTYVIGATPLKLKLKNDLELAWNEVCNWYFEQEKLTGSEFYHHILDVSKRYGYEFGNEIAGHIVGRFPHEQPDDPNDLGLDIHPDNHASIFLLDKQGKERYWILEIHFVDRANQIGGFFEQLLIQENMN